MKKLLFVICTILFAAATLDIQAQSVTSEVLTFSLEDVSELFMPPELYVDIDFSDANDNKILEAEEKGMIKLILQNRGGKSDAVSVSVNPTRNYKGLTFNTRLTRTSIASNGSAILEFQGVRTPWI